MRISAHEDLREADEDLGGLPECYGEANSRSQTGAKLGTRWMVSSYGYDFPIASRRPGAGGRAPLPPPLAPPADRARPPPDRHLLDAPPPAPRARLPRPVVDEEAVLHPAALRQVRDLLHRHRQRRRD